MFDSDYQFKGKHATYVKFLSKDQNGTANVFERMIDVYMLAPIIGKLYGRTALIDRESTDTARIFTQQMIREQYKLKYIYRLIMLCHEEEGLTEDMKVKMAFKDDANKDDLAKNMDIFHSYMLGGVEVLYEKFSEDNTTRDDYLYQIYKLIEGFKQEVEKV